MPEDSPALRLRKHCRRALVCSAMVSRGKDWPRTERLRLVDSAARRSAANQSGLGARQSMRRAAPGRGSGCSPGPTECRCRRAWEALRRRATKQGGRSSRPSRRGRGGGWHRASLKGVEEFLSRHWLHHPVEEDEARTRDAPGVQQPQCLSAVRRGEHGVAVVRKELADDLAKVLDRPRREEWGHRNTRAAEHRAFTTPKVSRWIGQCLARRSLMSTAIRTDGEARMPLRGSRQAAEVLMPLTTRDSDAWTGSAGRARNSLIARSASGCAMTS